MAKKPEIHPDSEPDSEIDDSDLSYDKFNDQSPWKHVDLIELYRLYQYGLSLNRIARFLGRSVPACDTAMRKIMTQQILHTSLAEVEEHYHDDVVPELLQSKYYVEMDPELSIAANNTQWGTTPWLISMYFAFVLMVMGCGKTFDIGDGRFD